jgi:hydrogenase maturation protease
MNEKIAIVGVGNLLLGDEGFGVHVINKLKDCRLPENVKVYECGTGALSLLNVLEGFEKAIILDAVKLGGKPGTVYSFKLDEDELNDGLMKILSLHELNFAIAIKIGKKAYKLPKEIIVIGVEPKAIKPSLHLTSEVKKSVSKVIHLILKEIKKSAI